jgi:hypothetical protein
MEITRRERLLAKVCWPEIDTQRTEFWLVNADVSVVYAPIYAPNPRPDDRIGVETINLDKWAYRGKRHNVVARWGYSSLLDTVVIRDVRVEHHTAQAVVPVLRRMFAQEALGDG